jgi:hypothetical protein
MNFKTIDEKIKFLNMVSGGTLGITHYTEWELSSYADGSLFRQKGIVGHVCAKGFEGCIDKAIQLVLEEVANG